MTLCVCMYVCNMYIYISVLYLSVFVSVGRSDGRSVCWPACVQHAIYLFSYLCIYLFIYLFVIEGSLEVKLPTIWTDEKQRWKEKVSEERRSRCPKRQESRETLRFSDDLWVPRVEK